MVAAVVADNEVYLYGVPYRLKGIVTPHRVQPFGGRFVIGDPSRSDQLVISEWIMADWRGGLGVFEMDERTQQDRFWDSTALTIFKKQLTNPLQATDTGNGSLSGDPVVYAWCDHGSDLYAAFDTHVKKFNNTTGAWGSDEVTLAGNAFSAISYDGKLFFFSGDQYDYLANGTWSRVNVKGRYAAIYDNKLVTLDNTGQIRHTLDGVTWVDNVKLPLAAGNYTDLATFWNQANEPTLYVGTKYGVWVVDFWTQQAYQTVLTFAPSTYGGKLCSWKDGYLYVADGLPVHRFSGSAVTSVGLDRDDGLPSDLRGSIVHFSPSPNWLIAALDATGVNATTTDWLYLASLGMADVVNRAVGYSAVLAWTGVGWHVLFRSASLNTGTRAVHFSTVHSQHRLWFGADGKAKYIVLPEGVYNPLEDNSARYELTSEHTTPWFDGGFTESPKIAVALQVGGRNLSATRYVQVYYATDGSATWTLLTTATEDDPDEVRFGGGPGVEFKRIRFKFALTSDSAQITPGLLFASLRLRKIPRPVWGFSFQVDCTAPYRDRSPAELLRCLKQAGENKTPNGTAQQMGEFAFRDSAAGGTQAHWVNVSNLVGRENSGSDEWGVYDVTVVAP